MVSPLFTKRGFRGDLIFKEGKQVCKSIFIAMPRFSSDIEVNSSLGGAIR